MASSEVRIYEVGPRDGLQAESAIVGTDDKLRFIELLTDAGLREIETTSFVSPTAIPQLADADAVLTRLDRHPGVRYPVLVPNQRGMERALAVGADAICVFTAATESYARHNINMSIAESIDAFRPVVDEARRRGFWTRAYVSTAFGCPYEGEVAERAVVDVSRSLMELGVDELAISDTLGVARPSRAQQSWAGRGLARLRTMSPMEGAAETSSDKRPVILDVDTGIDDMVALLIAATAPELNLRGVTCVAGNVELHDVARNTGKILRLVGRGDVPVSIGAARPMMRRLRTAYDTHGPTGTGYVELRGEDRTLGKTEFTPVPASRYLGAHVQRHPGDVTVVALGPLTNLGAAISERVDLRGGLRELIWMGGTLHEPGNTTGHIISNASRDP